jgi:hypothetical protein
VLSLQVDASDTIADVKQNYYETARDVLTGSIGLEPKNLRVILNGCELKDDCTLSHYGIQAGWKLDTDSIGKRCAPTPGVWGTICINLLVNNCIIHTTRVCKMAVRHLSPDVCIPNLRQIIVCDLRSVKRKISDDHPAMSVFFVGSQCSFAEISDDLVVRMANGSESTIWARSKADIITLGADDRAIGWAAASKYHPLPAGQSQHAGAHDDEEIPAPAAPWIP